MKKQQEKQKKSSGLTRILSPRIGIYLVLLFLFSAISALLNPWVGLAEAGVSVLLLIAYLVSTRRRRQAVERYIAQMTGEVNAAGSQSMLRAPLPMVVFRPGTDEVIWTNDRFARAVGLNGSPSLDTRLTELVPGFSSAWLLQGKAESPAVVYLGERRFHVYGSLVQAGKSTQDTLAVTYWLDVTELVSFREKYYNTRPVVSILIIDNYEDLIRNISDSARTALRAAIEEKLQSVLSPVEGLLCRYDRDRYLLVFEEQHLTQMQSAGFPLLEAVRQVSSPNGLAASLTMGIGMDAGFAELYQYASLAAEMSLSRGGDQAVIKNRFTFEFYGGGRKEPERRTRVRSRVMASALGELIASSSRVYVMGHRFPDMDCVGAWAGICALARKRGSSVRIILESGNSPGAPMIQRLLQSPEYADAFISPQDAIVEMDIQSLLVVVDTNRPGQVQSKALLESCGKVAVIDHHRRTADSITGAALSYLEPAASSACELIAELLQYVMEGRELLPLEAEALLSGMVLDTKNFTIRTSSRTFEAAAFLNRCGADPAEVKRLFQNNLSSTIQKFDIVRLARPYRDGIALAVSPQTVDRVIAAQAADELINVAGITASFVLFPDGDKVNISARSIGDLNVQVVLEELGGGGNAASSGAQVRASMDETLRRLKVAIDDAPAEPK